MPHFTEIFPDIFQWTDTCNVYILREGSAALLIDLGDGSVLDHLADIGVTHVEWVLFTHHHREQCQGGPKLAAGTKVAASAIEKPLFENPSSFRKVRPTLSDVFTVYGASFVRPPVESIRVDHTFAKMDDFAWRGREFWVVETQGNSPGHTAYLLRVGERWLAFSGDLMVDGAKMHTWFDTEWDYGFAKGLYEVGKSAGQIAGYDPILLPSHGPVVREGKKQLLEYVVKLRHLAELYVRGYDIQRFDNCDQDNVSKPTVVPHVWQVTPHLFKFRGPNYWVNFAMLMADNGHAILIDCGLFHRDFLDTAIARLKERLGLKQIDAIFVTHMHGDHPLDADYVRQKYGAKLWAMEGVVDKFERPWDNDLVAALPFYRDPGKVQGALKFDRVLRDGETIRWENYSLTCDWMPGQTKYHSCLHGEIDGRKVAFTGDNIFASTTDPKQGGNEAVVARNGGALEEGYLYAARYLHGIAPDLIMGGHCWVMDQPKELIERYHTRMVALREAFGALSGEDDYRYMFDPYWVRAMPYRVVLKAGETVDFNVAVRNFRSREQTHRIVLHVPAGLSVEPGVLEGKVGPETSAVFPVKLHAAADAGEGTRIVAFDITRDGIRFGELFDFVAHVGEVHEETPPTVAPVEKGKY